MHPEILKKTPGSCPICGMDLVKKETGGSAMNDTSMEALLKPANEFVISAIPVTAISNKKEDLELHVIGKIAYDTRQAGVISSRLSGRVEKLYVRYKFQAVNKGQRIMDVYSPDLVTAQQNLIFILENDATNTSLIAAAKNKLQLLGMNSKQVAEIVHTKTPTYFVPVFSNYEGYVTDKFEVAGNSNGDSMQPSPGTNQGLSIKEGMYVTSGQPILTVYNPDFAWVLLDIFPEQQGLIKTGDIVNVVPETAPAQIIKGKIDYIEPVFRTGSKTVNVRVNFNNAKLQLPIGSSVSATIFISADYASWLPKEAVISTGRDNIVFKRESGGFRAHKVITGTVLVNAIQIISGLSTTDSVAANAQFLIDNEAFIKASDQ